METVEITVERLEKFIEAEVRLELVRKTLLQERYLTNKELARMLGLEEPIGIVV